MSDYHQFSCNQHTARKRHRCAWCGQGIEIGDQYMREKSVYDGAHQSHAWHFECLDASHDEAREEGGTCEFTLYSGDRPSAAIDRSESQAGGVA